LLGKSISDGSIFISIIVVAYPAKYGGNPNDTAGEFTCEIIYPFGSAWYYGIYGWPILEPPIYEIKYLCPVLATYSSACLFAAG
jgi:hypothetical protein